MVAVAVKDILKHEDEKKDEETPSDFVNLRAMLEKAKEEMLKK